MNGATHDTLVLLGMAAFDASVVGVWWFLCSRFMANEQALVPPDEDAAAHRRAAPSSLHRALGVVCLVLLIGLIVECSGSMVWYVARYGFSR